MNKFKYSKNYLGGLVSNEIASITIIMGQSEFPGKRGGKL